MKLSYIRMVLLTLFKDLSKIVRIRQTLTIHSLSDVTFGNDAFQNSQIQHLDIIWGNGKSGAIYVAEKSTVQLTSGSFKNCNQLSTVNINTKGNVDIKSNSFQDSPTLSKLNIHADGKAIVGSSAFSGCTALNDYTIDSPNMDVAPDAFPGGGEDDGDKKGSKSSSHKDDEGDQSSAKTLGNIDIKTVYLGTSPSIVLNLNFMLSFFRKVRKAFGHIIPPPDLVHSAI